MIEKPPRLTAKERKELEEKKKREINTKLGLLIRANGGAEIDGQTSLKDIAFTRPGEKNLFKERITWALDSTEGFYPGQVSRFTGALSSVIRALDDNKVTVSRIREAGSVEEIMAFGPKVGLSNATLLFNAFRPQEQASQNPNSTVQTPQDSS